jgi:predicted TIM-barrel fold metal-dependent hydrolase
MIIDCHTHVGEEWDPAFGHQWAFKDDDLIKHMDGPFLFNGNTVRVDKAMVMPVAGITIKETSFLDHHKSVLKATEKYPDRLIGTFMCNIHLGAEEAVKALRFFVNEKGFRALKLHPTMHRWWPERSFPTLEPIIGEAVKLRIPILVHTGDPPYGLPVQMAPLAERFRDANFVLCHFGTQMTGYALEAIYVAKKNDNVYLETGWGFLPRVREGATVLGSDKLVFGTDCPPLDMGSHLKIIETLGASRPLGVSLKQEDIEKILWGNIARLAKLNRGS